MQNFIRVFTYQLSRKSQMYRGDMYRSISNFT